MRHLLPSPLAIAVLALRMGKAAPAASLKPLTSCPNGFTAGGLRAPLTAVAIAPVAVAANHHLAATTGTVEQTRTALHRPLLPMRAGFTPNRERYFPVGRASHGGGAASGRLWRSEPMPRLSQRPRWSNQFRLTCHLLDRFPRRHPPGLCPRERYSPPSLAILRVIHQQRAGLYRHPHRHRATKTLRRSHRQCRLLRNILPRQISVAEWSS
jgi:hypothetical protein